MPGTTPILPLGNKTVGNAYAGPDSFTSAGLQSNVRGHEITHTPVEVQEQPQSITDYPKYKYPKDGSAPKLIHSKEEEDGLKDHGDFPVPAQDFVPDGADDGDLEGKSRQDLASYGNRNFNLNLVATQPKKQLLEAIKAAALSKSNENQTRAEEQKQEPLS